MNEIEAETKNMVTNYLHGMYLSRNNPWSQSGHFPERTTDPPQCLLGGDLTAVAGGPAWYDWERVNHRKGLANGDPDTIAGMNAMYLGGHVVWQSTLPVAADKGELVYWLPGDIAVGAQIRHPVLYTETFTFPDDDPYPEDG